MSGLEAIVYKAERAISFSHRTKSLDSILCNEKSVLSEFSGEDSRAGLVTDGFKAGEFFLPNGESYSGSLLGSKPEGLGKYVWSDGSKYEGEWRHGMRQGYGKFQWPSGALYEGEFSGDYMHGTGTYTIPDEMTYKGWWRLNLKHGLGYQNYPNRDVFEGSWIRGTPEGSGKYTWANRNVYLGNMKGGKMSGKGILNWISWDSFEGNWLNGMIHGFGVYTWVDGGFFVGTWTRGLKDGKGLLPDLRKQNQVSHIHHATSVDMGDVEVGGVRNSVWNSSDKLSRVFLNLEKSHAANVSLKRSWSLEVSIEKVIGHYRSSSTSDTVLDGGDNGININRPILEREYI